MSNTPAPEAKPSAWCRCLNRARTFAEVGISCWQHGKLGAKQAIQRQSFFRPCSLPKG